MYRHFFIKKAQIPRALLSIKMENCKIEKVKNSIDTKLCANLLNKCWKKLIIGSALHNSMTTLCSALFKCENELKIG